MELTLLLQKYSVYVNAIVLVEIFLFRLTAMFWCGLRITKPLLQAVHSNPKNDNGLRSVSLPSGSALKIADILPFK